MSKKNILWFILWLFSCESRQVPTELRHEIKAQNAIVYTPNAKGLVEIDWKLLSQTNFRKIYDADANDYLPIAHFTDSVKLLANRAVRIKGFLFSLDKAKDEFVLSAKPESESFFCGKDSLDSVILVQFGEQISVKEKQSFVCGKLQLNDNDPKQLSFKLTEASICH